MTRRRLVESTLYAIAFASLISAVVVREDRLALKALLLLIWLGLLYTAARLETQSSENKNTIPQMALLAAAFTAPTIYLISSKYFEYQQLQRFHNYLSENHCKFDGSQVVGYNEGRCDRLDSCADGQEVEEAAYLCPADEDAMTFHDFKIMEEVRAR